MKPVCIWNATISFVPYLFVLGEYWKTRFVVTLTVWTLLDGRIKITLRLIAGVNQDDVSERQLRQLRCTHDVWAARFKVEVFDVWTACHSESAVWCPSVFVSFSVPPRFFLHLPTVSVSSSNRLCLSSRCCLSVAVGIFTLASHRLPLAGLTDGISHCYTAWMMPPWQYHSWNFLCVVVHWINIIVITIISSSSTNSSSIFFFIKTFDINYITIINIT